MAINRTTFSSIIPAQEQSRVAKVIVANTTMRGYLHLVTVRTAIVNDVETEVFQDILIHPDRAANIDITKFDAITLQGLTPRNPAGEARTNTSYHWASGAKAVGKHLVEYAEGPNGREAFLAGVGIYATAEEIAAAEAAEQAATIAHLEGKAVEA